MSNNSCLIDLAERFVRLYIVKSSTHLCNNYTTQPLVLCAASIFVVGSLLLTFAMSYSALLSGRLVVGLGVGIASMVIPVYISKNLCVCMIYS